MFGSLMGDFEDDPFFGSHMQSMQRMNNMMNSMFADPFGMMGAPALMDGSRQNGGMQQMMPFGGFPMMPMPSIGQMFSNMQNMTNNPNCHSFSSSSVMTMTSGSDGRPQIYQESMSTRVAPGGVKETKKTVSDSRTGLKKMAIGHHIGERAHILEREQNYHSGEQEERQEFINLDEEEADQFNQEWVQKTKRSMGAITGSNYRSPNYYNHDRDQMLALPSSHSSSHSQQSSNQATNQSRPVDSRGPVKLARKHNKNKQNSTSRPTETATSNNQQGKNSSSNKTNNSSNSKNNDKSWDEVVDKDNDENNAIIINEINDDDDDVESENEDEPTTIDLTKSPENTHNTSRKRSISPEIEEVEEHSNKKRLTAETD